jgi:hypothetical protein
MIVKKNVSRRKKAPTMSMQENSELGIGKDGRDCLMEESDKNKDRFYRYGLHAYASASGAPLRVTQGCPG